MKVYCPKHKTEELRTMYYHLLNKDKLKRTGKRQGMLNRTRWMFCKKCNKPYNPKVRFI